MLGLRVLQLGLDDLEAARQRHANAADDSREPCLGFVRIANVQRRPGGDPIEDRLQLDLLVDIPLPCSPLVIGRDRRAG
jgi:hypothetical protein